MANGTVNVSPTDVPIAIPPTESAPSVPPRTAPFQFLEGVDARTLLGLMADELPQTIALVLAHLPSEKVAEAVVLLAPEPQAVILRRISLMEEPRPEVVRDVAIALRRRFAASGRPRTGLPGVVRLLHAMKPSAERSLLSHIAGTDPELHGAIRCAMFGPDVAAYCDDGLIASDS